MKIQRIPLSEHLLRLDIEADWKVASADYDDACAFFRDGPVSIGRCATRIRAVAGHSCAQRLARKAIREEMLRTIGSIRITHGPLILGQAFRCSAEVTLRPAVYLPDYENYTPFSTTCEKIRKEMTAWLLPNAECEPPPHFVREQLCPAARDTAAPGSPEWDAAVNAARLIMITREIAERENLSITEQQFDDTLMRMAARCRSAPEALRATLVAGNRLDSFREHLLVEATLDHLATLGQRARAYEAMLLGNVSVV